MSALESLGLSEEEIARPFVGVVSAGRVGAVLGCLGLPLHFTVSMLSMETEEGPSRAGVLLQLCQ